MARRADVAEFLPMGGSREAAARPRVAVVPDGEERVLRRSLGPTAWAVLTDVCMDALVDAGGVRVVATSVRIVAGHVGIAKDTAARALRRLSAAGILRRRPQGASPAGRFLPGTYEVHLPSSATATPCRTTRDTLRAPHPDSADTGDAARPVSSVAIGVGVRRRARATLPASSAQLSLLDAVAEAIGANDVERS